MPIYRDKARGCYVFEFDRIIGGQRVRTRKALPKTWTKAKADAYDRQESDRIYAVATRIATPDYLIESAVALYIREHAPTLKSADNIIAELALMYWAYKGRPLSTLAEVCKDYSRKACKENGEPLAPSTLRNRIRYLTSACRYAWKHHNMGVRDPAEKVIAPAVRNERQFYISRAEMLQLCRACACRSTRAAIRIAFYSGMRMGEIIQAQQLSDYFKLTDTKNGEPRIVPIHPRIRPCLTIKLKDGITMSKRFKRAARDIGKGELRFHDLRHAAASEMINAGVDLFTVGAVLGHRSAVSTKRYAHLATDALKTALHKIGTNEK
ncbi:tyrosine-type recombinase/integrase [Alcaligenes sp. SDU_A2]|uniref:tyrosine-type recombinase/integrase n=1 Tax=Alcaligenes sp. SDU_A2 TaxID=3136634 RepID=UPI00311E17AB